MQLALLPEGVAYVENDACSDASSPFQGVGEDDRGRFGDDVVYWEAGAADQGEEAWAEASDHGEQGYVVALLGQSDQVPEDLVCVGRPELPHPEAFRQYRAGTQRAGNLTPRAVDAGALSFRERLSNPIGSAARPVFRPGKPYIALDPSRLPPGSVVVDNVPPGHVSVTGVTVEEFLAALVCRGKLPK